MVTVKTITCPDCNTTIYSRARHDFRECFCGNYHIDGGFEYTKIGGPPGAPMPIIKSIDVDTTREGLYVDWSNNENKYGRITNK